MIDNSSRRLDLQDGRTALLFAALAFAGMALTRLPLLVVLLGLAPLSIAVAGLASTRAS